MKLCIWSLRIYSSNIISTFKYSHEVLSSLDATWIDFDGVTPFQVSSVGDLKLYFGI